MSGLRFCVLVAIIVPGFTMLGLISRYFKVLQILTHRETPVSMERLSDKLAVGKPLPMKEELMEDNVRTNVFVARSERELWPGADPLECENEACGSSFSVVRRIGGVLDVFTNYNVAAKAWGIPLISDRWGTRPAETVTVVTDGSGVVSAIYRHADLDDLDVVLGTTHW